MISCTKDSEGDGTELWDNYRASISTSSPIQNKVYEYRPAPGQFINKLAEFTTEDLAIADATEKLAMGSSGIISLGGFGGYIVVGFDHSIPNAKFLVSSSKNYDFNIKGNTFNDSSEPGIVYVMQDSNENGEPDDIWYELKGSEYGAEETLVDYEVTYYKPADESNVKWTDNRDASGEIDYLPEFNSQRTYYPTWIEENSYTLKGVRLESNTVQDAETGFWLNGDYGWGYADNNGSDLFDRAITGFKISNAVDSHGNDANLKFIDFIKVQNGVNSKAGHLGEISTEVLGFSDAHLL